ncbi:hypothetical protein [Undibacterium sp. TJN19]|uniref:hypothetical protein n=1 Tax=Undibacterium sp. TJN19 TaxID=3413055 RepID=UPI003BEFDC1E
MVFTVNTGMTHASNSNRSQPKLLTASWHGFAGMVLYDAGKQRLASNADKSGIFFHPHLSPQKPDLLWRLQMTQRF